MENLGFHDIQKLNEGIQKLYTLYDLDTFGVEALSILDHLIPSDVPVHNITDVRTQTVQDIGLPKYPVLSPELLNIKKQYLHEHPIAQNMDKALHGAYTISDFIDQQELQKLEGIYQKFLRPLNVEDQLMLILPSSSAGDWMQLSRENALLWGFTFSRSQRSFTERDRLILNLLRPHLFQAYSNAQKHHQLQQSLEHLGLVILNCDWQIQLITNQAATLLQSYFQNSTLPTSQIPENLRSWVRYQISNITQNTDFTNPITPLCIQQADKQLTIRLVIESPNRYLLLLEEKSTSFLNSLEMLGLSQRETEVLALVIQGKENKAIASQMAVTTSTIRRHLESIYCKLDAKSRTEAIAKALEKLDFL
jgi:DNA-binding NarL/FixJ family response regulator